LLAVPRALKISGVRRILAPQVSPGRIELGSAEAHHLRDVLRLTVDAEIEVFDQKGNRARARIVSSSSDTVTVEVVELLPAQSSDFSLTIAAAIPKGPRADWMIEKLSELGVDMFIPLATARGVVLPRGDGKHQRWMRLASESARQSARAGVMKIEPLTELSALLAQTKADQLAYLSLEASSEPIVEFLRDGPTALTLLVGPEGGWTAEEVAEFHKAGVPSLSLTQSTLRIETAAIAAAAVVLCFPARA
jgi:16S rRNA (uracil1498-N3)-methyltransferase